MKNRPSFDPWPGEGYVWRGQHKQSFNWLRWLVLGIFTVAFGISAWLWKTAP